MSTTAWNGVHFRTIVVCQNWRKQPHTSELISSLRGACTVRACVPFRFRPFQSLRVHLCSGVNSYEGPRHPSRSVVQRSSVAPQSGDKKIHRQKNHRRKDQPQIRSFRANNYRINYSAGSARAHLVHAIHAHAHTCVKRRGYTDNGAKERPLLSISRGTRVRLIRARQI